VSQILTLASPLMRLGGCHRLTSIPSRLHRQERFWSRPYPRQNENVADPAVAIPVFAMKQITRLDHAMRVHHADAIGKYNLGFHAVSMGNVAMEIRPVAVVPSRPILGINERQSVVGGAVGNRDLPLPSRSLASSERSSRDVPKSSATRKSAAVRPLPMATSLTQVFPKLDRATDAVLRRMLATPPQPTKAVKVAVATNCRYRPVDHEAAPRKSPARRWG
jgi:hypothetical protein